MLWDYGIHSKDHSSSFTAECLKSTKTDTHQCFAWRHLNCICDCDLDIFFVLYLKWWSTSVITNAYKRFRKIPLPWGICLNDDLNELGFLFFVCLILNIFYHIFPLRPKVFCTYTYIFLVYSYPIPGRAEWLRHDQTSERVQDVSDLKGKRIQEWTVWRWGLS